MTAPRRATVLSMMLPHQGRPVAACAPSSTSSAARTGADAARASYHPPGAAADTDAAAHTGRAGSRALLWPGCSPSARSRKVDSVRSHPGPERHSMPIPLRGPVRSAPQGTPRVWRMSACAGLRPRLTVPAEAVTSRVALQMTCKSPAFPTRHWAASS